jgi:thiamine biosynthesis protein ThiS
MNSLIEIIVNGEPQQVPASTTIADLMSQMQLQGRRLAIERNQEIVPRTAFAQTHLQSGDVLEIVHAIGGG